MARGTICPTNRTPTRAASSARTLFNMRIHPKACQPSDGSYPPLAARLLPQLVQLGDGLQRREAVHVQGGQFLQEGVASAEEG
jgi:hypothetical protein